MNTVKTPASSSHPKILLNMWNALIAQSFATNQKPLSNRYEDIFDLCLRTGSYGLYDSSLFYLPYSISRRVREMTAFVLGSRRDVILAGGEHI